MSTPPPQQPQPPQQYQQYPLPQQPKKKRGIGKIFALGCGGILALIVVIIIIAAVATSGGGGTGETGGAPAEDTGTEQQEEGQAEGDDAPPEEGEAAVPAEGDETADGVPEDSEYDIVIDSTERTSTVGPDMLEEEAQGEYIVVEVSFTNNGSEAVDFGSDAFTLQSADGTTHDASSDAMFMEEALVYETVNPGNTYSGVIVYDVPEGTQVDSLVYQDIFDLFGQPVEIPVE